MPNPDVFAAVAFAAKAHQGQFRKDGKTPYVSHVVRVCLVVRHVFGFDDPEMLCAALLHDTIEDTTTDRDDIDENFGPTVGKWVAALTKNATLPFDEREADYCNRLAAADWPVKACKLADIYDNIGDVKTFSPAGRRNAAQKSHRYLDAMRPSLPDHVVPALELVESRLAELEAGLTS
ncbi:MAG TPA: HD domain-containing protein [Gemmataceae bacterium]|nr:HD domain-containing protein [Gemmataceae bacterium]